MMEALALEYQSLVRFKLLSEDGALPVRGSVHAGAFDIFAPTAGVIKPGQTLKYGLGIAHEIHDDKITFDLKVHAKDHTWRLMEIPFKLQGMLIPRSGLAAKKHIRLYFSPCLIDHDYRGEIHAMIENGSVEPFYWEKGDRICQIAYIPMYMGTAIAIDQLSETERGEGGFGSTGGVTHG
jgi:dUTPase